MDGAWRCLGPGRLREKHRRSRPHRGRTRLSHQSALPWLPGMAQGEGRGGARGSATADAGALHLHKYMYVHSTYVVLQGCHTAGHAGTCPASTRAAPRSQEPSLLSVCQSIAKSIFRSLRFSKLLPLAPSTNCVLRIYPGELQTLHPRSQNCRPASSAPSSGFNQPVLEIGRPILVLGAPY